MLLFNTNKYFIAFGTFLLSCIVRGESYLIAGGINSDNYQNLSSHHETRARKAKTECTSESDIDYHGNDYRNLQVGSIDKCATTCRAETLCTHFTFKKGRCYLKTGKDFFDTKVLSTKVTSGVCVEMTLAQEYAIASLGNGLPPHDDNCHYKCLYGTVGEEPCIPKDAFCDGFDDCLGGFDESATFCGTTTTTTVSTTTETLTTTTPGCSHLDVTLRFAPITSQNIFTHGGTFLSRSNVLEMRECAEICFRKNKCTGFQSRWKPNNKGTKKYLCNFFEYTQATLELPLAHKGSRDDSCAFSNSSICDEPYACSSGTDCSDCNNCDVGFIMKPEMFPSSRETTWRIYTKQSCPEVTTTTTTSTVSTTTTSLTTTTTTMTATSTTATATSTTYTTVTGTTTTISSTTISSTTTTTITGTSTTATATTTTRSTTTTTTGTSTTATATTTSATTTSSTSTTITTVSTTTASSTTGTSTTATATTTTTTSTVSTTTTSTTSSTTTVSSTTATSTSTTITTLSTTTTSATSTSITTTTVSTTTTSTTGTTVTTTTTTMTTSTTITITSTTTTSRTTTSTATTSTATITSTTTTKTSTATTKTGTTTTTRTIDFGGEAVSITHIDAASLTVGQMQTNFKFLYRTFFAPLNVRAVLQKTSDGNVKTFGILTGRIETHGGTLNEWGDFSGPRENGASRLASLRVETVDAQMSLMHPLEAGHKYYLKVQTWASGHSGMKQTDAVRNIAVSSTSTTTASTTTSRTTTSLTTTTTTTTTTATTTSLTITSITTVSNTTTTVSSTTTSVTSSTTTTVSSTTTTSSTTTSGTTTSGTITSSSTSTAQTSSSVSGNGTNLIGSMMNQLFVGASSQSAGVVPINGAAGATMLSGEGGGRIKNPAQPPTPGVDAADPPIVYTIDESVASSLTEGSEGESYVSGHNFTVTVASASGGLILLTLVGVLYVRKSRWKATWNAEAACELYNGDISHMYALSVADTGRSARFSGFSDDPFGMQHIAYDRSDYNDNSHQQKGFWNTTYPRQITSPFEQAAVVNVTVQDPASTTALDMSNSKRWDAELAAAVDMMKYTIGGEIGQSSTNPDDELAWDETTFDKLTKRMQLQEVQATTEDSNIDLSHEGEV